ncbi:helix-turn-helix transcriptional regulator [Asticcacaulis sp. BYS171W]|uniref:Helix-turn-helix transcriptional regulator n=1 Tax=Asticcacaulis aquaticus TaxID=2984212 RepID=A0ABT5HV55_9CAUL|nr:helix-turn-helix transcriptional regulator [Asticcacaulis aquaticus]MDC7683316.1 helix-turn-helix transcriptional regulator [Asticcacaulis aquaticus]
MENQENQSQPSRGIHPVDHHVGRAIRRRRKALGLTQLELALAVGKTFQQIQKYERGTNRVSASVLYDMATFLRCPIARFFDGIGNSEQTEPASMDDASTAHFLLTAEGAGLVRHFPTISSPDIRRKITELVKAIVADHRETSVEPLHGNGI